MTMPAIFIGHGNPMNALDNTDYSRAWAALGRSLPRPRAILSISAHHYVPFTLVTPHQKPPTLHDFQGFPGELYDIRYPAPGSPELARQIRKLLAPLSVGDDADWGLDHGTWSVLVHLFPDADIPVVQLSINESEPHRFHYELGKRLAPLRNEDVLIMGSGNVVHNLALWHPGDTTPFDWAVRFENRVRTRLEAGDHDSLIDYGGQAAGLAVPRPDHYLPLLYILGLRRQTDALSYPVTGMDGGSVSMLAVRLG